MENLLGFVAASISFVMWLPQARATWRHRHNPVELAAISLGTQFLVLVNATVWAIYAVLTEAYWSGAPGLVNLPLALLNIYLVLSARRHARTVCGCGEVGDHQFFVSAPAGFGIVRECHGSSVGGFPVPRGTRYDRHLRALTFPPSALEPDPTIAAGSHP